MTSTQKAIMEKINDTLGYQKYIPECYYCRYYVPHESGEATLSVPMPSVNKSPPGSFRRSVCKKCAIEHHGPTAQYKSAVKTIIDYPICELCFQEHSDRIYTNDYSDYDVPYMPAEYKIVVPGRDVYLCHSHAYKALGDNLTKLPEVTKLKEIHVRQVEVK